MVNAHSSIKVLSSKELVAFCLEDVRHLVRVVSKEADCVASYAFDTRRSKQGGGQGLFLSRRKFWKWELWPNHQMWGADEAELRVPQALAYSGRSPTKLHVFYIFPSTSDLSLRVDQNGRKNSFRSLIWRWRYIHDARRWFWFSIFLHRNQ